MTITGTKVRAGIAAKRAELSRMGLTPEQVTATVRGASVRSLGEAADRAEAQTAAVRAEIAKLDLLAEQACKSLGDAGEKIRDAVRAKDAKRGPPAANVGLDNALSLRLADWNEAAQAQGDAVRARWRKAFKVR